MTPQLAFQNNRWILYYTLKESPGVPEATLELQINVGYHGECTEKATQDVKNWNQYKMMVNRTGDNFQVVSTAAWNQWYQDVFENEGLTEAEKWVDSRVVLCPDIEEGVWRYIQVFEELIERWEAMQMLGLFRPSITL